MTLWPAYYQLQAEYVVGPQVREFNGEVWGPKSYIGAVPISEVFEEMICGEGGLAVLGILP
jgi:hypothetical protein